MMIFLLDMLQEYSWLQNELKLLMKLILMNLRKITMQLIVWNGYCLSLYRARR